jgi:hypothetical protein
MTGTTHTAQLVHKRIVETGSGKKSRTSYSQTTPLRFHTKRFPSSTPNPDAQRSPRSAAAPALQPEFVFTVHHIINARQRSSAENSSHPINPVYGVNRTAYTVSLKPEGFRTCCSRRLQSMTCSSMQKVGNDLRCERNELCMIEQTYNSSCSIHLIKEGVP